MVVASYIAMANYGIYMSTISYRLAAYGSYLASRLVETSFARDLQAGIAALYSTLLYITPMYLI